MAGAWEKHCECLVTIERKHRVIEEYLGQFWIWQPYSKYSLTEFELYERGYKNLGNIHQQKKGNQNER